MNLMTRLFNWIFKDQLDAAKKALDDRENELLEDFSKPTIDPIDESLSNQFSTEFDEFGCERIPGDRFSINHNSSEQYVVEPESHALIPYKMMENALRKTGLYKKYKLAEDFSDAAVSNDIIRDFMGFYGGSFANNNYFEWNFQKQRLMFERSQEECQKGVGKAIKDITTNFVLGDGIGFEYTDIKVDDPDIREEIYSCLWKIWQDNSFDMKQYTISDFIVERGEVFVKTSEDKTKQKFEVELIDPWEITDYLFDPNDRKVKCWFRDYTRNSEPIVGLPLLTEGGVDKDTGVPYQVHHHKFNVTETIVRGRSDVYCVLYWLKIYNDFLKCRSRLNRFRSSVAWHKKITGGTKAIGQGATKVQKPFPPGTVLVTDDKTEYKALKAEINAGDVKDDGDSFKIIIASSIQIPHHWLFGSGENTNLATAKNMSAVPKRKFLRRQKDIKHIILDIFWKGLRFYLDPKYTTSTEKLKFTEKFDMKQLKEAVASVKASVDEEQFDFKGITIKKKHLEIMIPNIDEHNSEDLLRLVNAAATMRKNAIGSNHAIYDMVGLNYRKDQELMENEIQHGDYEAFRTVMNVFNKFDNTAQGSPQTSQDADLNTTVPVETGSAALDVNKDGVVGHDEEPDIDINVTSSTLNTSKSARGGA